MTPETADLLKALAELEGREPTAENAERLADEISGDCRDRQRLANLRSAAVQEQARQEQLAELASALEAERQRRHYLAELSDALEQERQQRGL
jgi:hypothetical protein